MHPSTKLLVAALASSAAATHVNVVHILETLQVIDRRAPNVPVDALFARQGLSADECQSSLADIIKDMPTVPAELIEYAATVTDDAAAAACTQAFPLSLSKPILDSVTAFAYWAADKSQEAVQWMESCEENSFLVDDPENPDIINPGDLIISDCTDEPLLLFTDASSTVTVAVSSIIDDLREGMSSSLRGDSSGSVTATVTEASETAASESSATPTGSDTSAATSSTGAAESAGAGDNGSGASRIGLTAAGVAAVAGVAGFFVSL